jgi:hypothetical protein
VIRKKYIYLSILPQTDLSDKRNVKTQCTKKLAQTLELKKKIISLEAMSIASITKQIFSIDFHESAEILL